MPNPIVTTWTGGGPCTIGYAAPQDVEQWVAAALARAQEDMVSAPPTSGGPITTTWYHNGQLRQVVTHKLETETVQEWIDRHFKDVKAAIEQEPPDTV